MLQRYLFTVEEQVGCYSEKTHSVVREGKSTKERGVKNSANQHCLFCKSAQASNHLVQFHIGCSHLCFLCTNSSTKCGVSCVVYID